MPNRVLAVLCAGGVLSAAGARAETYRILDGALGDAGTGASEALEGVLEISAFDLGCPAVPPSLVVDDFELRAGARAFGPQEPVVLEGGLAVVQIRDQIHFDGDAVAFAGLRSGGRIVAADARGVTVRYLDFLAQAPDAGRLVGHLGDGLLPRRISLLGTLYEVDHLFPRRPTHDGDPIAGESGSVVIRGDATIGGADASTAGVIAIGGGGLAVTGYGQPDVTGEIFHHFGSFDIQAGGSVAFERFDIQASSVGFEAPATGAAALARVTGSKRQTLEGTLRSAGGSVRLLSPSAVVFSETSATAQERLVAASASASVTAPTLAELGITAPSGAEVTFDEAGALSVRSEGDLLVAGGVIDVPGLTSLTLVAAGSITVESMLEVPAGAALALRSGTLAIGGDPSFPPGDVVIVAPRIVVDPCLGRPLLAPPVDERELGTFSLVASAAEQVEIDFEPRRHRGSAHPGRRQIASVAILGSADLDIRDVDERSLRLGRGEAEPTSHHGRDRTHRKDVNRDGEMDLVARFDAWEAGIAVGDTEVCLFGETTDGTAIEGCDALEPRPKHQHRTK